MFWYDHWERVVSLELFSSCNCEGELHKYYGCELLLRSVSFPLIFCLFFISERNIFKPEFSSGNCWLHLVELSLGNHNRRATSSAILKARLWITIAYISFRFIHPDPNILFICGVFCISNHVEDVKWGVAPYVLSVTNFLGWSCSDSVGCYI